VRCALTKGCRCFVSVVLLGTTLTYLPPWHYLLEWNRLQTPLYGVALGLILTVLSFRRDVFRQRIRLVWSVTAVLFFFFLSFNARFLPGWHPRKETEIEPKARFEVLSVEVGYHTPRSEVEKILSTQPDIVGVWGEGVKAFAQTLGSMTHPFQEMFFGERVGILSRYPLSVLHRSLGDDASPGLLATIAFPGGINGLVAVFDLPPLTDTGTMIANRRAVRRVATEVRHSTGTVLVMGDIAGRLGGYLYSIFAHGGGLYDASWGSGGHVTGDSFPLTRLFSYDHLMLKGAIVESVEALPSDGSNAQPLRAELVLSTVAR